MARKTYVHCYEVTCYWNSGSKVKDPFRCGAGTIILGEYYKIALGWENHTCREYKSKLEVERGNV